MIFKVLDKEITKENVRRLFERIVFAEHKNPFDWCDTIVCNKETFEILKERLAEDNLHNIKWELEYYPGSSTKIKIEE